MNALVVRQGPRFKEMLCRLAFPGVLAICWPVLSLAQVTIGWEPSNARSVTYSVKIEHGWKAGQPEFMEEFLLTLNFLGDGRVEITRQGRSPVTFQTTPGGNLKVTNNTDSPPYIAVLILNSLPRMPTTTPPQTEWETRFPRDEDLSIEDDRISLQDRLLVKVQGVQAGKAKLELGGYVRGVRNTAATKFFGPSLANVQRLLEWNLFLIGTAVFDRSTKSLEQAEFFYLLQPVPGLTRDQLMVEESRQHALITRIN